MNECDNTHRQGGVPGGGVPGGGVPVVACENGQAVREQLLGVLKCDWLEYSHKMNEVW